MAVMEARLGFPMMLCGSAVTISVMFVNKFINMLGVVVSAAYGVGIRIYHIPNTIAMSISQAAAAMIGQNLGAGQFARVRKIIAFGFFTDDSEVLQYAMKWFIAMAIGSPAMATMGTFCSLITAVGDTKISMFIGFADALIGRVATTVLLGIVLDLGAMGLFVGFNLGPYFTAIPGVLYYFFMKWESRGLNKTVNKA